MIYRAYDGHIIEIVLIYKPSRTKSHLMAIKVEWNFPFLNKSLFVIDTAFPIRRYGKIIVD